LKYYKALFIADVIPPIVFLRREEAAEANTFSVRLAIAYTGGFRNDFCICHPLFSIFGVDMHGHQNSNIWFP